MRFQTVLLAIAICACTSGYQPKDMSTKFKVFSSNGDQSASKSAGHFGKNENYQVAIDRSALDEEFLFSTSLVGRPDFPSFLAQETRIVKFLKRGSKLFMLDTSDSKQTYGARPVPPIVAEFQIDREDGEMLYFDFTLGMKAIVASPEWNNDVNRVEDEILGVTTSYLSEVEINSERMMIRQINQIRQGTTQKPLEVMFVLRPYVISEKFKPVNLYEENYLTFFKRVSPLRKTGVRDYLAIKFDQSKPIEFVLSSNTPENVRDAIKDGVLYWNRYFGRDAIVIKNVPGEIEAPHPDFNVIQWVDNQAASSAYADFHVNPRTGEVIRAQIYLPSMFVTKQIFENEYSISSYKASVEGTTVLPDGDPFQYVDPATRKKVADDYLRWVTAHEVGHTLGLRHNFAGSATGNVSPLVLKDVPLFSNGTKEVPDTVDVGSSVMDYFSLAEGALVGRQIARGKLLNYDRAAIRFLYLGEPLAENPPYLFCDDSSVGVYIDCKQRDPLRGLVAQATDLDLSLISDGVISYMLDTPTANFYPERPVKIKDMPVSAKDLAPFFYQKLADVVVLMTTGKSLKYAKSLPGVQMTDADFPTRQLDLLQNDIDAVGGFHSLIPNITTEEWEGVKKRFVQLAQDVGRRGYKLFDGRVIHLTEKETKDLIIRGLRYLDEFHSHWPMAELTALKGGDGKFVDHMLSDRFASVLYDRARHYLTATEDRFIEIKYEVKKDYSKPPEAKIAKVPVMRYSYEVRMAAAQLLAAGKGSALIWGTLQRVALAKAYNEFITQMFEGEIPSKIKLEDVNTPEAQTWLAEQASLLSSFGHYSKLVLSAE